MGEPFNTKFCLLFLCVFFQLTLLCGFLRFLTAKLASIIVNVVFDSSLKLLFPVDTGRKLNVLCLRGCSSMFFFVFCCFFFVVFFFEVPLLKWWWWWAESCKSFKFINGEECFCVTPCQMFSLFHRVA